MNDDAERIEAYRWLVGAAGSAWLAAAAARSGTPLVELAAWLRRELSPVQTHLVLETLDLRRRAAEKFTAAGQMFYTRVGWEQATDQAVAAYKAARFCAGAEALDLCCGIGGDLLALARRGAALGIDRDPVTAIVAEANLRACGLPAEVACRSAAPGDLREGLAWHIDPDRRSGGRRTTHLDAHRPTAGEIDAWRALAADAAIKLSPATTPPAAWAEEAECEWIGRGGQCRQLVAWFGRLARNPGRRSATILAASLDEPTGSPPRTIVGDGRSPPPLAEQVEQYVYEPDAAVLAAHLTAELAAEHGLRAVGPQSAYLTSPRPLDDPALAGFAVLAVLPLEPRKIKAWLREHKVGRLEVKKRGVEIDPERLRRVLAVPGDARATLLATRGSSGALAILAERLG